MRVVHRYNRSAQRRLSFLVAFALLAIGLTACTDSSPDDAVTADLSAAAGGNLSLGSATVTFPADALDRDTTVTLTRVSHPVPDNVTALSAVYEVDLAGATLTAPAEFVIPMDRAPSADTLVYALTFDASGVPVNGGGTVDGLSMVISTMHFSPWTIVEQLISAFAGVVSALQAAWSDVQWEPTDVDCTRDTLLWLVSAPGGDAVSACGEQDTETSPSLIRINNRRLYPQFLRLSEFGLTVFDGPVVPAQPAGPIASPIALTGASAPTDLAVPTEPAVPTELEGEISRRVFAALSDLTPDFTVLPAKGATTLVLPLGDDVTGTRVEPAALAVAFQLIVDVLKTAYVPVQYVVSMLDCIAQDPAGVGASTEAVAVWLSCADAVAVGWDLVAEHPDTPPAPEYPPAGQGERTTIPTARCADGTLSYAKNWSGACSSRGGVAKKYEKGSTKEALAQTVTKVTESLTVALADAPMVVDLLTRGVVQGPSSQQVLAERIPFIATGPLGESWDAVGEVYDLAGSIYDAARTYDSDGRQQLAELVPPGGLAFHNAQDPPQTRVPDMIYPFDEPDELAGPIAAAALVQVLQTPPRWTTCPGTDSVELVYGVDEPGPAYDADLEAGGYSPELRAVITDALTHGEGYRLCISRDGQWRAFSRVGAPDVGTIDWSEVVTLDCSEAVGGPQSRPVAFADTSGDGVDDVFVVSACEATTSSWPDVLDVYDGASEPTSPRLIAHLLDYDDSATAANPVGLRDIRARGGGDTLEVYSQGFAEGEPLAFGSLWITDTYALTVPGGPLHTDRTIIPTERCADEYIVVGDDLVFYAMDIDAFGLGCAAAKSVVTQERSDVLGPFSSGAFTCDGRETFYGIYVSCYDRDGRWVSYELAGTDW